MTEIYLVRHGQSIWNAEHRWAGHFDPPLSELGRRQAREACSRFEKMGFEGITSSSLQRARETAIIISDELGIELVPAVSGLNERYFGEMDGLTSPEIEIRFPGLLDKWRAGETIEVPGGEPWPDFSIRVLGGLWSLSSFSGRVLAVGHEGVLRVVEHHFGENQKRHENLEGKWIILKEGIDGYKFYRGD
jgi:broad specificity phosphatase PhoE